MTLDADLDLIVCEHVTSALSREQPDGSRELLAQHLRGGGAEQPERRLRPLGRRDLLLRSLVRPLPRVRDPRERRLGWQGVFRIPPGGGRRLELVVGKDEFDMPNGLCFSPDESLLYINDTPRAHIKVWDVNADGTLSNGRMFFEGVGSGVIEEGIPDGMKCDERGNIWVTGPGGVWVISAARRAPRRDRGPGEHRQPDAGAARTGTRSSSRAPRRCTRSGRRSARAASRTCAKEDDR